MVSSIQSLADMEYRLYGTSGVGGYGLTSAPSVMNGYMMQTPYNNSFYYNYPYNSIYQANAMNYVQPAQTAAQAWGGGTYTKATPEQPAFQGFTQQELTALADEYAKNLEPSESFLGAAAGATAFSVLFHPRVIAHPRNTFKSFAETNKIFADVTKSGTNLAKAWADTGLNEVVRDAYTATNRIVARSYKDQKGLHIWRKAFADGEAETLLKPMKEALQNFNPENKASVEALIKETERLKQANVKNGALPKAWNWVKNIFRSEKTAIPSASDALGKDVSTKVAEALKAGKGASKSYWQTLKTSGGGIKGGIFFLAMEYLMSAGKIKDSFDKDTKTGMKQLGQTTVKGLGSAVGWAAGEALGVWGTTKLLAMAGTAIAPGVGTAIGAVAGMIVGSVGCWLAGKITKKIVGQDVGDKVQAENMAKTQDGQAQLLQLTLERMQKGEQVSPQAQQAVQRALSVYA